MHIKLPKKGSMQVEDAFQEVVKLAKDSEGWTFVAEKLGVKVLSKTVAGNVVVKGVGVVNAPLDKILEALTSVDLRKKWDTMYEKGSVLKTVSESVGHS